MGKVEKYIREIHPKRFRGYRIAQIVRKGLEILIITEKGDFYISENETEPDWKQLSCYQAGKALKRMCE